MAAQNSIHSTTQNFLDIYDITNDLLVMKDGATAIILSVNAINFGLFAEEEQDAVIYAYAGLLNSLNFPIQIVVRSTTKDVTSYLNLLKDQEEQTLNEEKKTQIKRYREFVSDLIRERNVLDKKFYVVIPANSLEMGLLPPSSVIPGVRQTDVSTVERSVILEKARNILEPKRDHLVSQFARIGLNARQLGTQEIIQLFYTSYNPEAAEGQQITDTRSYTSPLVTAQLQMATPSVIQSFAVMPESQVTQTEAVQEQAPDLNYEASSYPVEETQEYVQETTEVASAEQTEYQDPEQVAYAEAQPEQYATPNEYSEQSEPVPDQGYIEQPGAALTEGEAVVMADQSSDYTNGLSEVALQPESVSPELTVPDLNTDQPVETASQPTEQLPPIAEIT